MKEITFPNVNNFVDHLSHICYYAQEHISWEVDGESLDNMMQCTSYTIACFLAKNTIHGGEGVEWEVVQEELTGSKKEIYQWKKIIKEKIELYGGFDNKAQRVTESSDATLIQQLVEHDIDVVIAKDGFKVEGFYKHGHVTLKPNGDNTFDVKGRYGDLVLGISTLESLARINYHAWNDYKHRYEGWNNPDRKWIPILEKFDIITRHEQVVITYS